MEKNELSESFKFFLFFRERFAFPLPFTDPQGKLALSSKQRSKLNRWARPEEFIREPKMIQLGKKGNGNSPSTGVAKVTGKVMLRIRIVIFWHLNPDPDFEVETLDMNWDLLRFEFN